MFTYYLFFSFVVCKSLLTCGINKLTTDLNTINAVELILCLENKNYNQLLAVTLVLGQN